MRRRHHLLHAEQHAVVRRLLLEHIEGGARHVPRLDRRLQVGLDHQRAASAVDDPHAGLHLRERRAVDHAARCFGGRSVQADEIGPRVELVEIDLSTPRSSARSGER